MYHKSLCLTSNSFVDFEYSIKVITPHIDFQLISAASGSLKAGLTTEIEFSYNPSFLATAESVIEFTTSEFDAKPFVIRLLASC